MRRPPLGRILAALLVLLASFVAGTSLSAQEARTAPERQRADFRLNQNYPNPFNPETTIPFDLSEGLFADGRPVVVTLRIFNLLQQVVAVPVALNHPQGEGVPVLQLEYYQPGRYEAFWDGTDQSGRQVASGIYFMQLTVNGVSKTRKMYVLK
ncbi:MAG: FlgD immunoglobulin-like domain containing protein [Gemmatimonadota bacterium]